MTQRDTFLPVCKLVTVADNDVADVSLARTATFLEKVTLGSLNVNDGTDFTDSTTSGFTEGVNTFNVSGGIGAGGVAPVGTSATFEVIVERNRPRTDKGLTVKEINITEKGAYQYASVGVPAPSALGVENNGRTSAGAHTTASAIFTLDFAPVTGAVPYVTVTNVSGDSGYFRVFPSSGAGLYTSGTAANVFAAGEGVDTSGFAGIIGAAGTTVVLTLQPTQGVDTIHIENQVNGEAQFAVNYGVVKQANPLRDQGYPEVL